MTDADDRRRQRIELRVQDAMPLLQRRARIMKARYKTLAELDDFVATGYFGLRTAAERFDESAGVPFDRFAWRHIDGAMMNMVKKTSTAEQRLRDAGHKAVAVLDDDGDVLVDDEAASRDRLRAYTSAVVAAMMTGVVGHATGQDGLAMTESERDPHGRAIGLLDDAMARLEPEEALIVRRYYLEDVDLKQIAGDLGVGYATVRRRHQAALGKLAASLEELAGAPSSE